MTSDGLAQIKALIRFYLRTNPVGIDDIYKEWQVLKFALQFDGKLKVTDPVIK